MRAMGGDTPAIQRSYLYLEVRCLGCDTHQTVALDIVRRPKSTPIHELERYMRCKDCSRVRSYPYKRSHLVALRMTSLRNVPYFSARIQAHLFRRD